MEINKENLAWAAGLFEGEGCFGYRPQTRSIYAILVSTDRDVIETFHKLISFGVVSGTQPKQKSWKYKWIWRATNFEEVQALAALFWTKLHTRRKATVTKMLLDYVKDTPIATKTRAAREENIMADIRAVRVRGNRWNTPSPLKAIAEKYGTSASGISYYKKRMRLQ